MGEKPSEHRFLRVKKSGEWSTHSSKHYDAPALSSGKTAKVSEAKTNEAFIAPALSAANANAEHERQATASNSMEVPIKHLGGEPSYKSVKKHLDSRGIKAAVGTSNGYKTVHLSNMSHSSSEVRRKLGIS